MTMSRTEGSLRSCGVFIAGSGLVGSTFARLLVERGADVVMADAGDFHSRLPGSNRKNSWINQRDLVQYGHFVRSQLHPVPSLANADYPNAMVSYAVGGMAAHWTCAIPELHDCEQLPFIDRAEWRALYDRASALLNRHDDVFSGSLRQRAIKSELSARRLQVLDTPMAAEREAGSSFVNYTGADTVLGPLARGEYGKSFDLVPEQCVRRLVRSSRNEHAVEYAEVLDIRSGLTTRVYADTFVVAAGWLHTAQILWASGIQVHEGTALGRYFADHSFGACTILLKQEIVQAVAGERGQGIPPSDAPPHLYIPVADDRPWQGMIFRESYQFEAAAEGGEDLRGIDLKWFGMIQPVRDNHVAFSADKLDRLGMPAPRFRLRLSAEDRIVESRMMADMAHVAGHLGDFRPGAEPAVAPLGSAIHATGLTRVGPAGDQGKTSVADPWSKVWGLDNVYVGGTGVIPTATAANPTCTAVALAVRSAGSIGGRTFGPLI